MAIIIMIGLKLNHFNQGPTFETGSCQTSPADCRHCSKKPDAPIHASSLCFMSSRAYNIAPYRVQRA